MLSDFHRHHLWRAVTEQKNVPQTLSVEESKNTAQSSPLLGKIHQGTWKNLGLHRSLLSVAMIKMSCQKQLNQERVSFGYI